MFKRRSKAKQTTSSTPSQRSSLVAKDDPDSEHDPSQNQIPLARRDKLTLEEIRSRYGDPLEPRSYLPEGAVTTELENCNLNAQRALAAGASLVSSTNDSRKEIEEAAAGMPDDDWEAEQLRKVGMSMSKPISQDNRLEDIAKRLRKRLEEMDERMQNLEGLVNDLESTL